MPRDTPENFKAATLLHVKAREYRGRFLNYIACIEHDMASLLTEYFCIDNSEVKEFFFERVACRLTLEEKRNILVDIVKVNHPTYFEEHRSFLNDIQQLQSFRNKLAHSILDVSDEALARPIDAGVGFVQWKKGEPITEQDFDDWCVRANMVLGVLKGIKTLLPYVERRDA
jgi:hypothetical protein